MGANYRSAEKVVFLKDSEISIVKLNNFGMTIRDRPLFTSAKQRWTPRISVLKHRNVHRFPIDSFSYDVGRTSICDGAREALQQHEHHIAYLK